MDTQNREFLKEKAELRMMPMIDVVFLLLIFFMTTTRFQKSEGSFETYLPKDKGPLHKSPNVDLREVRIRLTWSGEAGGCVMRVGALTFPQVQYTVDKGQASPDYLKLVDFLEALKDISPERTTVKIDATGIVPYRFVLRTINACTEAGIQTIRFARKT